MRILQQFFHLVRFFIKQKNSIILQVDKTWFCSNFLYISGWALSKNGRYGIKQIEIYYQQRLLGKAIYGNIRNDVGEAYPLIIDSKYSGFEFRTKLSDGLSPADDAKVEILIKATAQTGHIFDKKQCCEKIPLIGHLDKGQAERTQHTQSNVPQAHSYQTESVAPAPPPYSAKLANYSLRILFVLYSDFRSNSATQVHHFANALIERGHQCAVTVPQNSRETVGFYAGGDVLYSPLNYTESLVPSQLFNGLPPHIIHAWTPREIVRRHCEALNTKYPAAKLIVHLEDNEEYLLEAHTGLPIQHLRRIPPKYYSQVFPNGLSHPEHYKAFLAKSSGVTVIMDTLLEFTPPQLPHLILWPIIDIERFPSAKKDPALLCELCIKDSEFVIVYTGNVHAANAKEVRELYLAVKLTNEQGVPCRLIRTGRDEYNFLGEEHAAWRKKYCTDLGVVSGERIPIILSIADMLIQPGCADRFNDYRLPSKIPEFLASGKPIAIPKANIGCILKHAEEAMLLHTGDAAEISSVIRQMHKDKTLKEKLSEGGRKFAIMNFDKNLITERLERFYENIVL